MKKKRMRRRKMKERIRGRGSTRKLLEVARALTDPKWPVVLFLFEFSSFFLFLGLGAFLIRPTFEHCGSNPVIVGGWVEDGGMEDGWWDGRWN